MPAVGGFEKGTGKAYPGNLTPYVTVTCVVAAMGDLIFGYDIGISGKRDRMVWLYVFILGV